MILKRVYKPALLHAKMFYAQIKQRPAWILYVSTLKLYDENEKTL